MSPLGPRFVTFQAPWDDCLRLDMTGDDRESGIGLRRGIGWLDGSASAGWSGSADEDGPGYGGFRRLKTCRLPRARRDAPRAIGPCLGALADAEGPLVGCTGRAVGARDRRRHVARHPSRRAELSTCSRRGRRVSIGATVMAPRAYCGFSFIQGKDFLKEELTLGGSSCNRCQ